MNGCPTFIDVLSLYFQSQYKHVSVTNIYSYLNYLVPGAANKFPVIYRAIFDASVTNISKVFYVHQNYGPWFDVQGAGIYSVFLIDLHKSKKDLSSRKWTYQVKIHLIYQLDSAENCPI